MNFLRKKAYSPYIAGILIGLLQIPALLLIGKTLGSSAAFGTLGENSLSLFGIAKIDSKLFSNPQAWWQVFLLIGVIFGAHISAKLSHMKRPPISPVWKKTVHISSLPLRSIMAFIGGFILLFGARMADGCAAGHGLSLLAKIPKSREPAI